MIYIITFITYLTYIFFIKYYNYKLNKTYDKKNYTLSDSKTCYLALFNLLIMTPIILYFWLNYFNYNNNYLFIFTLFDILNIIPSILLISLLFAFIHYIFHKIPFLYKYIHKLHHQAVITKPSDCLYVHPIEYLLTMAFPLLFSCFLFKLNIISMFVVIVISIHENVYSHYSDDTMTSEHNFHHLLFNVNYDGYPYLFSKYIGVYKKKIIKKDNKKK